MAIGDDALAAGMDLVSGSTMANTLDDEINKSRDYIAQRTNTVTPVAKGGTGATTAAAARTALGITAENTPSMGSDGATPSDVQADIEWLNYLITLRLSLGGGTITGDLLLPNSTAAVSSYTVAYINGDGRVSRGASSERYKHDIHPIDPDMLGDVFPELHEFILDGDTTETVRYGFIAEQLAANVDQQPFVVYDAEDRPDSIDFISLLMVQNAQLNQAVQLLAQRITDLEDRHADD